MSRIEIKVSLDPSSKLHMDALKNLTDALSAPESALDQGCEAPKQPPKKRAPRKKAKPVEVATEPVEEVKVEEVVEEPQEAESVSIEAIRSLLAVKVGDNRTEIKKKLTELKAKNVTTLDKEHYESFYSFLNSL